MGRKRDAQKGNREEIHEYKTMAGVASTRNCSLTRSDPDGGTDHSGRAGRSDPQYHVPPHGGSCGGSIPRILLPA